MPESSYPPGLYTAQSPTLHSLVEYNEASIWEEVDRIVNEPGQFTSGQNLYFQIPYFANAEFFYNPQYDEWIEEVMLMDTFNMPPARSLDEAPAHRIEMYQIIKQELNACRKHQENHGRKKT